MPMATLTVWIREEVTVELELLQRFGAALAIGLLVGLERERSQDDHPDFAGVRTFPLFALLGACLAWLSSTIGAALVVAGFCAVGLLVTAAYVVTSHTEKDPGSTTEVAALVVYGLGVTCMVGPLEVAAGLGVVVYLLLALRRPLRAIAGRLEPRDLVAIGKLGLLTVLVLPLVPDRALGPWGVINPRTLWIFVILIAGVGFVGYLLVRFVGARHGFGLTGLLGGVASSTAVTLSFSQKARADPQIGEAASLAIVVACTTMLPRLLVVLLVVYPPVVPALLPAVGAMGAVGVLACAWLWTRGRRAPTDDTGVDVKNPFELGPALRFAALFAVVLVVARALEEWLGDTGLYLSALVAGTTDADAVALSAAQLAGAGEVRDAVAAAAITLGIVANTVAKGAIAAIVARGRARRLVPALLLAMAGAGAAVVGVTWAL